MRLYLFLGLAASLIACQPTIPPLAESGIRFSTQPQPLPENLRFREIGFASELINLKDLQVVISGGPTPISTADWSTFKPLPPWTKNLDRHLHFDSTAFLRSPSAPADCQGSDCLTIISYRDYTWLELARPVAVSFIPAGTTTDLLTPDPGHLVVKTIEKCQAIMFTDTILRLSDGQGNAYVLHASEAPEPSLAVALPAGWHLEKVALDTPLVVPPFGAGEACYHNILGDALGQGYHQYQFAGPVFPAP